MNEKSPGLGSPGLHSEGLATDWAPSPGMLRISDWFEYRTNGSRLSPSLIEL